MNPPSTNARLRPFRPVPFGRYTLLTQLATGGMGEIFLARLEGMQGFEKLCVIKKILPQLAADPEFVERFVGEARTLVKLSHGSIAQVLDMGLQEGDAYMALEYVDGKDLRKVAARARDRQMPMPLTFVLFVMGRVLDALAYAHRKKGDDEGELHLVHRDISPQNILISYEGEVKVIDFGLAKSRLSAAKTNPSIILGKFLYMSPEQARHQPVDRRSDLYAVGLCLYELLSGKNPFDALPPGELMSAVANPHIPPLSQVAPGVPEAVSQLVMKALAVEPTQRFQAAEELRGRLNACLLEADAASGPEDISRYMHALFTSEYLAERRLLVLLRDVGRAPEPESEVIGMPEGAPPRPVPLLPPKTIRLDGDVEALSFKPTPRTREGASGRDHGETQPGVTQPGVSLDGLTHVAMDEPTRPAVLREAIEESRRPSPSAEEWSRRATLDQTLPLPIEDTPGWSAALPRGEDPSPPVLAAAPRPPPAPPAFSELPELPALTDEPPALVDELPAFSELPELPADAASPLEAEELPAFVGTDLQEEQVDVRLEDTHPRIHLPPASELAPLDEDTHPRVSLREVHPPPASRGGLDGALADVTSPTAAPVSSSRSRLTGSRIPRRRVLADGSSVPVSSDAMPGGVEVDEDRTEERPVAARAPASASTVSTAPGHPEPSRRRWWPLMLAVLAAGSVVAWAAFILLQPPEASGPEASRHLARPSSHEPAPSTVTPPATPPAVTVREPSPPPVVTPAPTETPTLGADAGVALADAGVALADSGPVANTATDPALQDEDLLAPLASPAGAETVPGKTAPTPAPAPPVHRPHAFKGPTELQKEWGRTRVVFTRLTRDISCANLDFLCGRYAGLEDEVKKAGDSEDPKLLARVRQLQHDITKKKVP